MKYDVKMVDHWDAPDCDGAPLLCMPNVPLPCHQLCPRTINPKRWDYLRKKCYMDANYTCQASGAQLGHGHCHSHELISVDWAHQTATFKRTVCLDPVLHVRFIHNGRALTLFEKGDPQMTQPGMVKALQQGFSLIHDWNVEHSGEEPLRVYAGFLQWAKHPALREAVEKLVEAYDIKFYDFDWKCFNKENWPKWKLVYDGKEYPTKFKSQEEWAATFNPQPAEPSGGEQLPDAFGELDALIKEFL